MTHPIMLGLILIIWTGALLYCGRRVLQWLEKMLELCARIEARADELQAALAQFDRNSTHPTPHHPFYGAEEERDHGEHD